MRYSMCIKTKLCTFSHKRQEGTSFNKVTMMKNIVFTYLVDLKFSSVVVLSIGFSLIRLGSETSAIIAQTALNSVKLSDPSFTGNAYISLSISHGVFAVGSLFGPSFVTLLGLKPAMILSAFGYVVYIAAFIEPVSWILYSTSVLAGAGAAILWNAQGTYLAICSDSSTISRNSGVFWAINQCCYILGNVLIYYQFDGKTEIDTKTRRTTFTILTSSALCGVALLSLLKNRKEQPKQHAENNAIETSQIKPEKTKVSLKETFSQGSAAFKEIISLLKNPPILLLSVTSVYTGMEQAFWNGVFPTAVGNTLAFGDKAKQLVGLVAVTAGIGGVSGGVIFGLLGSRLEKIGRSSITFLGFAAHASCYVLVYLNHPNDSLYKESIKNSVIDPPSIAVAVVSAFLLGFGDACYQTQLIAMFSTLFRDNLAPAFAVYKFVEAGSSSVAFFASSYASMLVQCGVLLSMAANGCVTYALVDFKYKK